VGGHELSQRDAVDEDDPRGYPVSVGDGLVGEAARGDETLRAAISLGGGSMWSDMVRSAYTATAI